MSSHRDPNHTFSAERRFEDLVKAVDNGNIAIQTWTLPRGNVPIMTLTPASVFIRLMAINRSPRLLVDKLTEAVRKSVATEGDHLHTDIVGAMAYALTSHPEKALDWWLSVGIVRQFNISSDSIRAQIDALVHPLWSPQLVKQFNPATGKDEPYYDA